MRSRVARLTELINKVDTRVIIFAVLCINHLSFTPTNNEEAYYALSKQFFDNGWMPDSFTLNQWSGARYIFQYCIGFFLKHFSFESVSFFGRLFSYGLFAFPLSRISKLIKITNVELIFLFQIFLLPHQYAPDDYFFGREWIFGGFEVKIPAYICVFFSLLYLLRERFIKSSVLAAAATYFHVLVGGWFFLFSAIYAFITTRSVKTTSKMVVIYSILVLPHIVYLASFALQNLSPEVEGVDLNWVFVYFRNAHHLAPFKNWHHFSTVFMTGVLSMFAWVILCQFFFKDIRDEYIKKLNTMNLVIFSILTFFLIVAIFDRNGFVLKFFPFRLGGLALLLVIMEGAAVFKEKALKTDFLHSFNSIILILALPFLITNSVNFVERTVKYNPYPQMDELAEFVTKSTRQDDVFLFIGYQAMDTENVTFFRKTRRDRFADFKFIPTRGDKMAEWLKRITIKEALKGDIDGLLEVSKQYKIDYVVSSTEYERLWLPKVFENGKYRVYKFLY